LFATAILSRIILLRGRELPITCPKQHGVSYSGDQDAEPHGFDFVGPDQSTLPEDDPDEDDTDAFAFPDNFGGTHESA
jgi:hypothetical protein